MKKLVLALFILFCSSGKTLAQQFPITILPQVNPPVPVNFYNYADGTTLNSPLRVQLLLRDITINDEQIRLKVSFDGNGIAFESRDIVIGAAPLFISGGEPLSLTNVELAPYFEFQNLQGINPNIYGRTIPEGSYQFCFEVFDFSTGNRLSSKTCVSTYIFKNEPPILNLPLNGYNIEPKEVENIVFQWTPRHINVSNVEYELSIVEIWDDTVDPQTAFLSLPPVFETTTRSTSFVYGPTQPLLLPEKRYAWRVRAKALQGAEEIGLFRNQGNSQIFWFSRTSPCNVPINVYAEPKGISKINVFWEEDPLYTEYTIAYREANKPNAQWFTMRTNSGWATIWDLKPGTTYEYKVKGKCKYQYGDFSETQEITTATAQDETANYNCGIVPDAVAITNREPNPNLKIGDRVTAGDFVMTITELESNNNGRITGRGYVKIPYFKFARFGVKFNDVLINTSNQLAEGEIITLYDPAFGEGENMTVDVDLDVVEMITGDKGELSSGEVDFVIADIKPDENNAWIITGTNGEQVVVPGGQDVVIRDESGTAWTVGEDGTISQEQIAEGGAVTEDTTSGLINDEVSQISATGVRIDFEKSGFYAFDKIPDNVKKQLGAKYKSLAMANGEVYQIPYKVISDIRGEDKIKAKATFYDDNITTKDIVFKTKEGIEIPAEWSDNTATLSLKRKSDYLIEEILATVKPKKPKEKHTIAGAFNLVHLGKPEMYAINLVIVPVNNATVNSRIQEQINTIYNKVGVNFKTIIGDRLHIPESVWDIDQDDQVINAGDSGILNYYSKEEKAINEYFKIQTNYNKQTYYLFVTDLKGFNSDTAREIDGFMPLKGQFGFVFQKSKEQSTTIAHELGHGVFGLEHPFVEYKIPEKSTDFLMDYNGGTVFNHMDWKKIHAPGFKLYWFQDDNEGEFYRTDGLPVTSIFKLLRCEYHKDNPTVSFELSEKLKELGKPIKTDGYNVIRYRNGKLIVPDQDEFKTVTINTIIRYKDNPKTLIPSSGVTIRSIGDGYFEYNLGDIIVATNELSLSKLFNSNPKEEFKAYITSEGKYSNPQTKTDYVYKFLSDDDLSNDDINFLLNLSDCELETLNHESRFKILSLLSQKWTLFEKRENLVLDILRTTSKYSLSNTQENSYDLLLTNFQNDSDVYKIIFERTGGDNKEHLLDELFTIWSGSTFYETYHSDDSGNYNVNVRNSEFYREFKKEIERFIYNTNTSECLSDLRNLNTIDLRNCLKNATSNDILSITLEDRKFIIEKLLSFSPSSQGKGFKITQECLIRLISLIPEEVDKDDFINYLTETKITVSMPSTSIDAPNVNNTSDYKIITALFNNVSDASLITSGDFRLELIKAFSKLKLRSESFKIKMNRISEHIQNFDMDGLKEDGLVMYEYDYQNILKRLYTDLPFTENNGYVSLETKLVDNNGNTTPKISITQFSKIGLGSKEILINEKKYDPFDIILFVNTSKLPLLSDFSKPDASGKNVAAPAPAILAHYAASVGEEQTQSDIIQTTIDVGTLFIPGGQLSALGKAFYYADKISSLTSIAGTFNREENPKLSSLLNKISLATGLVSMADLAISGTKLISKTPDDVTKDLVDHAEKLMDIIKNQPDEIIQVLSSENGVENIEKLIRILEKEKEALGSAISPSDAIKVDEAVSALKRFKASSNSNKKLSEEIEYIYDDPDGLYLDLSLGEIHIEVQNLIKQSELPEIIKAEFAKVDDFKMLRSLIDGHSETLFDMINSSNIGLVDYTMFLIKGRKEERFDYKTYKYLVAEAEKVFELAPVEVTQRANNGGYRGAFFDGEVNGNSAVFKYDRNHTKNAMDEMEKILKDLERYGGPEFYGRYRVQLEDGSWREVIGMEKITGYNIKEIERRVLNEENLDPDNIGFTQVAPMYLKAIDDIENQLLKDGNRLIEDINLGDFILTNDPNRPIVMLDMLLEPGTSLHQGLVTSGTNRPIREIIEELIEKTKNVSVPRNSNRKYQFENEGYVYKSTVEIEEDGAKLITHYLKKEGEKDREIGVSSISKDGLLYDYVVSLPDKLKRKEVSKAVMHRLLKEDINKISSEYPNSEYLPDNYNAFMNTYSPDKKNEVEAVLATPEGKVLGKEWIPTEIRISKKEILLSWVRKTGNSMELRMSRLKQRIKKARPNCK